MTPRLRDKLLAGLPHAAMRPGLQSQMPARFAAQSEAWSVLPCALISHLAAQHWHVLLQETLVDVRRKTCGDGYGTSAVLEKQYLRLTSAPAVSAVRPPAVLEQALQLVKEKWLQVSPVCYARKTSTSS